MKKSKIPEQRKTARPCVSSSTLSRKEFVGRAGNKPQYWARSPSAKVRHESSASLGRTLIVAWEVMF